MPKPDALTVGQALVQAQLIDASLAAWEQTAPHLVASLGGRDALARRSEMTCVGPVPRLDVETWQSASTEYAERRSHEQGSPYAAPAGMYEPGPPADPAPQAPPAEASHRAPRAPQWRSWTM
jgi:hypothetical protein